MSHDGAEDPVFNYASKAALDLWEMDWDTFTSTPSRFSAEPDEREARAELLRRVTEDGYANPRASRRAGPFWGTPPAQLYSKPSETFLRRAAKIDFRDF